MRIATRDLKGCLAAAAATMLLAGCSQSNATGSTGNGASESVAAAKPLTYYLDQTAMLTGDKNVGLQRYKAALSLCEHSGLTVTPLSPADVAKLRTTRIQVWKASDRMARQEDGWRPTTAPGSMLQGGACHFTGVEKDSTLTITLPGRVYSVDLIQHTGTVEYPVRDDRHDKAQAVTPADESALEKKAADDGIVKGQAKQVAGQPCVLWSYNKIPGQGWQACTWSAGKQWGIPAVGRTFPLSMKTLDGEYSMTTTAMTVGRMPEGDSIFKVPANIKIRDHGDASEEGVGR